MKSIKLFVLERLKISKDSKILVKDPEELCKIIYDFIKECCDMGQLTRAELSNLGIGDPEIIEMIIDQMINERKLNKETIKNLYENDNIFIRVFMLTTANVIRLFDKLGHEYSFNKIFKMVKDTNPNRDHSCIRHIDTSKYKNYCLIS